MNLRQLRAFHVVGRLGSVTGAASELNIAQPALTRLLKELQGDLGVKLLQRHGRGIALTEAGSFLLERSAFLLHEYDRLVLDMRAFKDHLRGRLSLGLPTAMARLFGASLVAQIRDSEDIDIKLLDGWTGFIAEWLTNGRIDVGIVYDPLARTQAVQSELFGFEPLFLVCTPESPFARQDHVTFAEVAHLPLVMPSRGHALRLYLDAQFDAIGQSVVPVSEMDSMTALKTVVADGQAYSVIGEADAMSDSSVELVTVPITEPELRRPIYLAWTKSFAHSIGGIPHIDLIKRTLQAEVESGRWRVALHR